jgi:hypothetical protein
MVFIKYIGLVLALFGIIIGSYFLSISYDSFIATVSDFVSVSSVKGISDPEGEFRSILTPKIFFRIKLFPLLSVIMGVMIFMFASNLDRCAREIVSTWSDILADFRLIDKKYLQIAYMVIMAGLITRLYYASGYPVGYDEAWTYIYFTTRGFLTSISFYPAPNNHVLNSVLTNLTYYFPFNQTINLRLPSIVIGTVSVFAFYLTFRRFFNDRIALWLVSIFSFLNPMLYYGHKARGYALVTLSFVICFYGAIQIVKSANSDDIKRYGFYLSFGAVMGLYSQPSFLYSYFALTTFLVLTLLCRRNIKQLKIFFTSVFITGGITVLLYSPLFIVSGFSAISANERVSPIPRVEVLNLLYGHFAETARFLFYSEWVLLLVVFLSIFLLMKPRFGSGNGLASYIIYICPIILLLHSVVARPRDWVYLVIPVLFLLGSLMKSLSVDKNEVLLGSSAIFLMGFLIFNFNTHMKIGEKYAMEADALSSFLVSNHANKIYVNHLVIKTNLIYLFEEKEAEVELISSRLDPLKDNILTENNFDFLILGDLVNNIPGYKLIKKLCVACRWDNKIYIYEQFSP